MCDKENENESENKINYIYLLQEREFIKTNENIYKIGKSNAKNLTRFKQYPKNSVLLFQSICNNCNIMEKIIIKVFKKKFIRRKDIGNEYFEGDYEKMINIINLKIRKYKKLINKYIKNEDIKGEDIKGEDIKGEDLKSEDIKGEDVKNEDVKNEDIKGEDVKNEDIKGEDIKGEDLKNEDVKNEDINIEDGKNEDGKNEDLKNEDVKSEDVKTEYVKNNINNFVNYNENNNLKMKYKCERCFYNTHLYTNIIKHINIKNICLKNIESYKYSNDQLFILSILSRNIKISEKELKNYEFTNLYENKNNIIELFSNINCNSIKKCKYCLKDFNKLDDLKKHILIDCYKNNIINDNSTNNITTNNITTNNITTNNITNDNSTNNITNNITNIINDHSVNNINININLEIKGPIPFNQKLDLSDILNDSKLKNLFENSIYTNLSDKNLKNNNINVIIKNVDNSKEAVKKLNKIQKNIIKN